ncbi:hypothetical protein ACS127_08590 [Amphibacillus sp. Q70]|uniref:hypothetical protein n=1 Tax=Amphibacillus sp. Q70 TaxID=3453416 RepID=UPI003F84B540
MKDIKIAETKDEEMTFNNWTEKVTGTALVNIYGMSIVKSESRISNQKYFKKMEELSDDKIKVKKLTQCYVS